MLSRSAQAVQQAGGGRGAQDRGLRGGAAAGPGGSPAPGSSLLESLLTLRISDWLGAKVDASGGARDPATESQRQRVRKVVTGALGGDGARWGAGVPRRCGAGWVAGPGAGRPGWPAACTSHRSMSPVVQRRPDGIVQILPRPRWQLALTSLPAAIGALALAFAGLVLALSVALTRYPMESLLLGGCVALGLATSRCALRAEPLRPAQSVPPPPRDVA